MPPSNIPPTPPIPKNETPDANDPFLGTQLVLLSRSLALVAESVQKVYAAMDSVFIGPAERETTSLPLGPNGEPLTLADLLGGVERFATEDGIRLVREGSQDSVIALQSTLDSQVALVDVAALLSASSSLLPTQSFHSDGVHRSLVELAAYLDKTREQARKLP